MRLATLYVALIAFPYAAVANDLGLLNGFYVWGEDMPCEDASNATLGRMSTSGFSPGYRIACEFVSIDWTSKTTLDYTEICWSPFDPEEGTAEFTGSIEIHNERTFTRIGPSGEPLMWAHCPQEYLPDPWRTTDLSE